jgi:hypothetical protein
VIAKLQVQEKLSIRPIKISYLLAAKFRGRNKIGPKRSVSLGAEAVQAAHRFVLFAASNLLIRFIRISVLSLEISTASQRFLGWPGGLRQLILPRVRVGGSLENDEAGKR